MTSGAFTPVASGAFAEPTAVCPAGKVPLSGGVFSTTGGIGMVDSYPSNNGGTLGWTVTVFNFDTAGPDSVQAHAMCMDAPPASRPRRPSGRHAAQLRWRV